MTDTANSNAGGTVRGWEVLPPITVLVTPHLKPEESARLLDCINKVRSGEKVYLVRVTNHKVTKAPKRLPPKDYVEDPALRPHAHEGWLVEARINRKGKPFIRIHDEARRPPVDGREFGFTCISMDGIESFKVLGERPGPQAQRKAAQQAQYVPPVQTPAQTILALQAQGMFMMGQAMVQMAQAMMGQAAAPPIQTPPVPPPAQAGPGPEAQPVP